MSAPNLENELTRARRENARLLKRLLDVMDRGANLADHINSLDERVSNLEALIEQARSTAGRRRGHAQVEPTNQVAEQKE